MHVKREGRRTAVLANFSTDHGVFSGAESQAAMFLRDD